MVRLRLVLTDVLDERFIALDKGVHVRADLVQAEHEINVMIVIRVVERQRREVERAENVVYDRAGAVNAAHVRYARPHAKALDQRVADHAGAVKMAVVHRVRTLGHDRAPVGGNDEITVTLRLGARRRRRRLGGRLRRHGYLGGDLRRCFARLRRVCRTRRRGHGRVARQRVPRLFIALPRERHDAENQKADKDKRKEQKHRMNAVFPDARQTEGKALAAVIGRPVGAAACRRKSVPQRRAVPGGERRRGGNNPRADAGKPRKSAAAFPAAGDSRRKRDRFPFPGGCGAAR